MKFTIREAANILGVECGRLREWVVRGYIEPKYPSTGKGLATRLGFKNLVNISIFIHAIEAGISRDIACKVVKAHGNERVSVVTSFWITEFICMEIYTGKIESEITKALS